MYSIPLNISETALYRKLWKEARDCNLTGSKDDIADQVWAWIGDMQHS